MYYVGVDLHKKSSYFCILNDQGKRIMLKNVTNDESSLRGFMASIPQPFTLAFESTFNWYFFADLAHQFTDSVLMAKPFELKAFAKQHKKNDKIDAQLIASVLFRGFLPTATIADQYTREVRELLRSRITLVSDRSRNIIRLKNFMDKIGRPIKTTLTAHNHLQAINTDHLPLIYVKVINDYKERIHFLNLKLSGIKKDITTIITADRDMIHLQTIPGIGFFSAALIKSEIMDISRFKSFNRLCAYAGLAPRTISSAQKLYHGPINKNRRKYLQWILLENVFKFAQGIPKANEKFQRLRKIKNHNTAKVILARDFLRIVYCVLKEQRPFYQSI
ncbi:MAG: IS110 family transposase [Candidatus Omnitrophica bacterium]|nr:IS110 family transposase [Candidatus Omnitrophota bacterium]